MKRITVYDNFPTLLQLTDLFGVTILGLVAVFQTIKRWLRGTETHRKFRPRRLVLEFLEDRDNPAILVYTGVDGGFWSDPNSWTELGSGLQRTPVSTDDLIFGGSGGGNVSSVMDIPDLIIGSISTGNTFTATVLVDENLTVTESISFYGTLFVDAGVTLTSGSIILYGNLEIETAVGVTTTVDASLLDMVDAANLSITQESGVFGGTFAALAFDTVYMAAGTSWETAEFVSATLTGSVSSQGSITFGGQHDITVTGNFTQTSGAMNIGTGTDLTVEGLTGLKLGGMTSVAGFVTFQATEVEVFGSGVMELLNGTQADVTVNGDLRVSSGTVRLTDIFGILQINGNYQQFIGTLDIPFAYTLFGGGNSGVIVSGSANLGGKLQLTALDERPVGFAGNTIAVLSCFGSFSGDFDTTEGPIGVTGWVPATGVANYFVQLI